MTGLIGWPGASRRLWTDVYVIQAFEEPGDVQGNGVPGIFIPIQTRYLLTTEK